MGFPVLLCVFRSQDHRRCHYLHGTSLENWGPTPRNFSTPSCSVPTLAVLCSRSAQCRGTAFPRKQCLGGRRIHPPKKGRVRLAKWPKHDTRPRASAEIANAVINVQRPSRQQSAHIADDGNNKGTNLLFLRPGGDLIVPGRADAIWRVACHVALQVVRAVARWRGGRRRSWWLWWCSG